MMCINSRCNSRSRGPGFGPGVIDKVWYSLTDLARDDGKGRAIFKMSTKLSVRRKTLCMSGEKLMFSICIHKHFYGNTNVAFLIVNVLKFTKLVVLLIINSKHKKCLVCKETFVAVKYCENIFGTEVFLYFVIFYQIIPHFKKRDIRLDISIMGFNEPVFAINRTPPPILSAAFNTGRK